MDAITSKIWLGNSADAANARKLKEAGVTAILNCAFDLAPRLHWPDFVCAHCGLVDGPGNDIYVYRAAVNQLKALLAGGHKVLVHCHKGESRSATIVMMYLEGQEPMGWDHWLEFLRSKRHIPPHNPHVAHKEAWNQLHGLCQADSVKGGS